MAENKMEQVAELFGKKLGEEFTVNWSYEPFVARFTEKGLEGYKPSFRQWFPCTASVLNNLLIGDAEIVEDEE